jgi:uncharacterized membrane protein YfcA
MPILVIALVAGFVAQMVNGSLGMGFGTITMTVLLGLGIGPAVASASINLATVATDVVSGYSHWRLGNIHWPTAIGLAIPGAVGGFAGAWALTSLANLHAATPVTSAVLIALGVVIVWRFSRTRAATVSTGPARPGYAVPTGLVGGFLNAVGGGGWGPVTMPVMLTTSRLAPYQVVGSVSAAETAAAAAAVLGFWWALPDTMAVMWPLVLGMAIGGMVAAPFAAWLTRKIPTAALGATIGFLVILLNLRTFAGSVELPGLITLSLAVPIAVAWVASLIRQLRRRSQQPALQDART